MSEEKRRKQAIIPTDSDKWAEQLAKMYMFDAMIYNMDRNPGNLLITDSFDIRLIDHSRSFRPNAELRNKEDLARFSRSLLSKIESLDQAEVNKKLSAYLRPTQIEGLMKRRQLLLDFADELVRQNGEKAVYFP